MRAGVQLVIGDILLRAELPEDSDTGGVDMAESGCTGVGGDAGADHTGPVDMEPEQV